MAKVCLFAASAVLILALTACGGATTSGSSSTKPPTASTTVATQPITKISANSAPQSEIEAALSSAGVSNAARWAREVVEDRPYPADDPNLTKLRNNLAKDNPGQETVDNIVSALTP
ncbi:MAG: hypothetical protein JWR32_2723 [Mycobacterium sp.]|jgi:hypothetical protein|nr:hypothetical protein [Mycobacterium sp.]